MAANTAYAAHCGTNQSPYRPYVEYEVREPKRAPLVRCFLFCRANIAYPLCLVAAVAVAALLIYDRILFTLIAFLAVLVYFRRAIYHWVMKS